jgi:hypothetical protein
MEDAIFRTEAAQSRAEAEASKDRHGGIVRSSGLLAPTLARVHCTGAKDTLALWCVSHSDASDRPDQPVSRQQRSVHRRWMPSVEFMQQQEQKGRGERQGDKGRGVCDAHLQAHRTQSVPAAPHRRLVRGHVSLPYRH